jgi:hypothetical protein
MEDGRLVRYVKLEENVTLGRMDMGLKHKI